MADRTRDTTWVDLAKWGTFLATSARGREVRDHIEAIEGDVALNLHGVEDVTPTFADHVLAAGNVVAWSGGNEDVTDTIQRVADRRCL